MEFVVMKENTRMRRPKDEDKVISPMFPRLHVNDTEKGGPRAPPRNKMALYEQLSIPSQRFGPGSAFMMPLPRNNESTLASSMSSSHAGGFERSVFTPFCNSQAPSCSENSFTQYSGGLVLSSKMASQRKSVNSTDDQSLNSTQPLSSSGKCNSFQSHNSNFENFSTKKPGDANDLRVPGSAQSGSVLHCSSSSHHSKDQENQPCWNLRFSMQFKNVSEKQNSGIGIVDLKARDSLRNQTEENRKMFNGCQDPAGRSFTAPSDKTSADTSFSPSAKVKSIESFKRSHPSSNQEYRRSSVDFLKSSHGLNARLDPDFVGMQDKTAHKDKFLVESAGGIAKENASKVTNESCSKLSLRVDNRIHNVIENASKNQEDRKQGSLRVDDQRCNLSETSIVDSLSALDITPDDVVRVIGEKQFWKARKAIVDQQRTFRVQVFELHRIIKVQKLIAESPDLLLEDSIYLRKELLQSSSVKKVAYECAIDQPPLIVKLKDSSRKQYPSAEFADEHAAKKLPLPSVHIETGKGLLTQPSNHGSHSGGAFPASFASNTGESPWCFPVPGNQWLVPVMSPSEGLVYKPYTGPCPPHSGYMAPIYANCHPPSLAAGGGDFLNAAYGVPASHQQRIGILPGNSHFGQTYFPLCGMPIMSPSVSSSAVEQVSPFVGPQSKNNSQLSVGDINFTFPHHNSCNMSSQMSHAISYCVGKVQASKESEIHGSTASSPPQTQRPKGQALPLFPTEPSAQASDQNAQNNEQHVIKVVPHNPRSATESAARIFQSIQAERKQFD